MRLKTEAGVLSCPRGGPLVALLPCCPTNDKVDSRCRAAQGTKGNSYDAVVLPVDE